MREPPVDFSKGEEFPLFNRVQFETSSYCNRSCSFCPISSGRRPKQKLMTQELFDSVVSQLTELEFDGIVNLFHLNEPTLDKRLPSMLRQIRDAMPHITLYISTNADTITRGTDRVDMLDRITDLFDAGLNVINLNIYDSGEEQAELLNDLAYQGVQYGLWKMTTNKYRKHPAKKRFVAVTDMRVDRLKSSSTDMFFARSVEDRQDVITAPQVQCGRPHRHLVIRYDGKVMLCCALDPTVDDALTVGDLNTQSIVDVWNCEQMFKYRYYLQQAKRTLPGCSTCNHRMAYSHVVRKVTANESTLLEWSKS